MSWCNKDKSHLYTVGVKKGTYDMITKTSLWTPRRAFGVCKWTSHFWDSDTYRQRATDVPERFGSSLKMTGRAWLSDLPSFTFTRKAWRVGRIHRRIESQVLNSLVLNILTRRSGSSTKSPDFYLACSSRVFFWRSRWWNQPSGREVAMSLLCRVSTKNLWQLDLLRQSAPSSMRGWLLILRQRWRRSRATTSNSCQLWAHWPLWKHFRVSALLEQLLTRLQRQLDGMASCGSLSTQSRFHMLWFHLNWMMKPYCVGLWASFPLFFGLCLFVFIYINLCHPCHLRNCPKGRPFLTWRITVHPLTALREDYSIENAPPETEDVWSLPETRCHRNLWWKNRDSSRMAWATMGLGRTLKARFNWMSRHLSRMFKPIWRVSFFYHRGLSMWTTEMLRAMLYHLLEGKSLEPFGFQVWPGFILRF